MTIFDEKKPAEEFKRTLSDQQLDEQDDMLKREESMLAKVNKDPDRASDETVMLQYNIGEARKALVVLQEKLVLVDFWRAKLQ